MRIANALRTAVAVSLVAAVPALAQAAKTATQFYTEYQAAFAKAKSVDDLMPFMSKENVEQMKKASPEEKKQGFEMMKAMATTNVKVLKETKTETGAVLEAEGVGGMGGAKAKGTITLAKDAEGWHIVKESWSEGAN